MATLQQAQTGSVSWKINRNLQLGNRCDQRWETRASLAVSQVILGYQMVHKFLESNGTEERRLIHQLLTLAICILLHIGVGDMCHQIFLCKLWKAYGHRLREYIGRRKISSNAEMPSGELA